MRAKNAETWQAFDAAVTRAVPYSDALPIDKSLGIIPETMRHLFPHGRSHHPLMSYIAIGLNAHELIAAQRLDRLLGPLEVLAKHEGDVLLLGVTHTSNTAIHLAEQPLGRSRFYRYIQPYSCAHSECRCFAALQQRLEMLFIKNM